MDRTPITLILDLPSIPVRPSLIYLDAFEAEALAPLLDLFLSELPLTRDATFEDELQSQE